MSKLGKRRIMKIAVVDDFRKDRDNLALQLESYIQEYKLEGEIYSYPSGEDFLDAFEAEGGFDLVFLDIYMNGMDGMKVAKELRLKDRTCQIVFVTSSDSFAIEGYKVRAFRYLVKPYSQRDLQDILEELFVAAKKERPYLEVREDRISKKIYLNDIVMAELDGHYTILYLENGEQVRTRMTVRELAEKLTDRCFLECYRNVLVNLDYVDRVEEGMGGWEAFVLRGGQKAQIQKAKRSQVRQYFTDYLFWKAEGEGGKSGI